MKLNKRGFSVLVAMILGLILILIMIPVVKYVKDSSDSKFFQDQGINPKDDFIPFNYNSKILGDDKIALASFDLLTEAINSVAQGKTVDASTSADSGVYVSFTGEFEAGVKGGQKQKEFCSFYLTKTGSQSYNCKDYFDNKQNNVNDNLRDKIPYDINGLYTFNVATEKGECKFPDGYEYEVSDLKTRGDMDSCSDAPNFVICNGYKVSYCGKAAWNIKVYVEKTSAENNFSVKTWDSSLTKTANFIKKGLSKIAINPIKPSTAFCDGGKIVDLGNNKSMCLNCDPTRKKCDLIGFELPQKINQTGIEKWLQGYGDPKYIVYYEMFPQGEEDAWQISKATTASIVLTTASVTLDMLPAVGKLISTSTKMSKFFEPVNTWWTNIKAKTVGKAKDAVVNGIRTILDNPSTEEILSRAMKIAISDGSADAMISVNKGLVSQEVRNSLNSVNRNLGSKLTKNFYDDISSVSSKYVDSTGEIMGDYALKFPKEASDLLRQKLKQDQNLIKYLEKQYVNSPNKQQLIDETIEKTAINFEKNFANEAKLITKENLDIIRFQKGLTSQDRYFVETFKNMFQAQKSGGSIFYKLDEKAFDDIAVKLEKTLSSPDFSREAKQALYERAQKMEAKMLIEKGDDLAINKFAFILDDVGADITSIAPQIDAVAAKYTTKTIYGQVVDGASATGTTVWNNKGRMFFATVIAMYAAQMDKINEKYTPSGVNKLSLSTVSLAEQKRSNSLDAANDYFIRIDKGRGSTNTDRFFLASPCKTDLDIRIEKCSCAVDDTITNINGQWTGYLIKTKTGYIPVKNVNPKNGDYYILSFDKTTAKDTPSYSVSSEITGGVTPDVYDTSTFGSRDYPVLVNNPSLTQFAVKECNSRGWWSKNVFNGDNVDIDTGCITISESSNSLDGKYYNYNNEYNFCYSSADYQEWKDIILTAQVGLAVGTVGTGGTGAIIAGPLNVMLTFGEIALDKSSKWPNNIDHKNNYVAKDKWDDSLNVAGPVVMP